MNVTDMIYLNKRDDEFSTWIWAYYRVTSLGGQEGDHIQVCLLKWPSLEDIDVVGKETLAKLRVAEKRRDNLKVR